MPIVLNDEQHQKVEDILVKLSSYLEARYKQVRRVNPKIDTLWGDLTWQQLAQMRLSLGGDKPYGPERFLVADMLLGDDIKKLRDLFNPVSQSSLLGEIVERRDDKSHGTAAQLDIHDMRSLWSAIDPSVQSVVQLIQTFIWWDLEDAADLARFDRREASLARIDAGKLTAPERQAYQVRMKVERALQDEEIAAFELKSLRYTVDSFRARRNGEKGYQMIIVRESSGQHSDPDMLIGALAQENNMLKMVRSGREIDESTRAHFAKGWGCSAGEVTAERLVPFLERRIAEHKTMLKDGLLGATTGEPRDLKKLHLEELEARFEKAAGPREAAPVNASQAPL